MNEASAISSSEDIVDSPTLERLHSAADATASWKVIPRPSSNSNFQKRVRDAQEKLKSVETALGRQSVAQIFQTGPHYLLKPTRTPMHHPATEAAFASMPHKVPRPLV